MVFAMLIAAIIWNLGTWWFGLPASSSHTLSGSIIGVGVGNALMRGRDGTAGVDWAKATEIGYALILSPLFGFCCAAGLLLCMRFMIRQRELYQAPVGEAPPPFWVRALLIFTCTGVSFFHGSNDGQKGMGLIMLILIGTVPTAYALNRSLPESHVAMFAQASNDTMKIIQAKVAGYQEIGTPDPREILTNFVRDKNNFTDGTYLALSRLIGIIENDVKSYGSLAKYPAEAVGNTRNDMYLVSAALKLLPKVQDAELSKTEAATIAKYKSALDKSTQFIPTWVKICIAIALGLGTMVGWKRIVVTVGEKIGKSHLTYAQGAAAEITAMGTIGLADGFGLPVSTTHVLSSGVAGAMAANGSGVQMGTIRSLLLAWVLTLPCAIALSATLFFLFRQIF